MDEVVFTDHSQGTSISKWNWFLNLGTEGIKQIKGDQIGCHFSSAGIFPVVLLVENTWGCKDTMTKSIRVEEDFNLFVPNVFTPNNDGLNDIFLPVGRGIKTYKLVIFDRWGHLVFQSTELSHGWDGRIKNEECPQGEFNWKIQASSLKGQNKSLIGSVLLSR
jgi:gliding motility-associated-like protein